MISRALLVALCTVYATSLTPLSAPADDDCALYLTGPGRSSAYDYSLNLLKGNFAYDGQHTCITYDAINQAYLDARNRILVSQPKGDWKAEDFASVGELILDISISLARTYGLTYEEVEKGLPLIDTSRTLIREACPPVFSHVECRAGKYRRLDGLCNNLKHPTWGATMAPFQRLIGPLFADGINAPRISHTGRDLPLSRVVSRTMHPDDGFHDHAGTVMVIAWGQFMDHDYTLTGTPLDPVHRNDPEECCKRPPHLKHPYCNEIRVPDDDYFYRLFGVKCIDFVRGFPSPRPGCRLGSRVPFNTLTGAIDGNTVYGVTEKFARKLRTGYGGLLRMNPVFKEYGLKDLLPLKLDIPDEGCTRPNKNMYCFEAGEIRVNEQLVLTVMHTLMAREHNRVAEALAAVNPHWDDETLFQEARRINIAEIQHITYNEFLPILLGKDVMEKFGLVLAKEGYWDGYDEEVNPDVIASFASAAYRFGHSLLPTAVERWSKAHKFIASKRLSDLIRRPYDLYRAGVLDEYVMGLMNQVAQAMDDSITQEVTNHLFKKVGARFGMDLVSFNMQRGREFGIPGYMEFRKFCGLSGADTFQDLFGSMANETIRKYETIFEHPIDVDLWSGGVSERPLAGSMLGPTFACIIATQFSYSRRGDRFWFELPNQPSSFTPEQLAEIRKSRLARVICDNTDIIDTVQLYPMVLPDHELNPRVPCRSGIIPSMDFSKWADPVPFLGGAKEYMTDAFLCNETANAIHPSNCSNSDGVISKIQKENTNSLSCMGGNNNTNCLININKNNCKLEKNCSNVFSAKDKNINSTEAIPIMIKQDYAGDKIKIAEKSRGHFKNRLKRRKRSLNSDNDKVDETFSHGVFDVFNAQNDERKELNLPKLNPHEIITKPNLADFSVETLHKNNKLNHKKTQKGGQRYNNHVNNNRNLPKLIVKDEISTENSSNEEDKYETFIENEDLHKKRSKTIQPIQKQGYHDDISKKRIVFNQHYLPDVRESNEDSEDINSNIEKEDSNQEEFDDISDENYKRSDHKSIKPQSIESIEASNLRYKTRKNKFHISQPKENYASKENNKDDEYDETLENDENIQSSKNNVSQKQKQSYTDDKRHSNEDNLSYRNDGTDEDIDDESVTSNENIHAHTPLAPQKQNEKYNNEEKYRFYSEPRGKDVGDIHESKNKDGDNYEENVEYIEPAQNFTNNPNSHGNRHSPDIVLDKQNLRQSNEQQNKLPPGKQVDDKNDYYDKTNKYKDFNIDDDDDDDDDDENDDDDDEYDDDHKPSVHLKSDRDLPESHYPINNIQGKQNKIYENEKNKYPSQKFKSNDQDDQQSYKSKEIKDDEQHAIHLKNGGDLSENSYPISNIPKKQNQIYDNEGKYPSKKLKNNDEEEHNSYKSKEKEDNELPTVHSKNNRGTSENRYPINNVLRKQNKIYNNERNKYPLQNFENNNEENHRSYKSEEKDSDEKLIDNNYNREISLHTTDNIAPFSSLKISDTEHKNSGSDLKDRSERLHRNSKNNSRPTPIKSDVNKVKQSQQFDEANSNEDIELLNKNYKYNEKIVNPINTSGLSTEIQEFDLDGFSYDKFKLSNVPDKEAREKYESVNIAETSPSIRPNLNINDQYSNNENTTPNFKKSNQLKKQIQVKNPKTKSVLTMNNKNSGEQNKKKIYDNVKSRGVIPKKSKYRKFNSTKPNDANIKKQYNSSKKSKSSLPGQAVGSPENTHDENVNFKFVPDNNKYDENLKIKFGDIKVKLPEIKLPEDILKYPQGKKVNHKDKLKPNDYNSVEENVPQHSEKLNTDESPETNYDYYDIKDVTPYSEKLRTKGKVDGNEDEFDFFASYIDKSQENLKKEKDTNPNEDSSNADIEDGEDLYERFVRERFGRKDYFKERSEKLQEKKLEETRPTPKNKKLFETIQKAIKKAEEVQKEAQKSNDPKANYLWTLEYGEKL